MKKQWEEDIPKQALESTAPPPEEREAVKEAMAVATEVMGAAKRLSAQWEETSGGDPSRFRDAEVSEAKTEEKDSAAEKTSDASPKKKKKNSKKSADGAAKAADAAAAEAEKEASTAAVAAAVATRWHPASRQR